MSERKQHSLLKKKMKDDLEKDRVRKQKSRKEKRELQDGKQVNQLQETMQGKKNKVANKQVTKQKVIMKKGGKK